MKEIDEFNELDEDIPEHEDTLNIEEDFGFLDD